MAKTLRLSRAVNSRRDSRRRYASHSQFRAHELSKLRKSCIINSTIITIVILFSNKSSVLIFYTRYSRYSKMRSSLSRLLATRLRSYKYRGIRIFKNISTRALNLYYAIDTTVNITRARLICVVRTN